MATSPKPSAWAVPWLALACLCALLALTGRADAKGVDIRMSASPASPRVGDHVHVSVRVRFTLPETREIGCRHMRVVVVAPGVSVRRALGALEGGRVSRRLGRWDAFRLASLRGTRPLTWEGTLRPGRPGRWTLVVPNACAQGYMLPLGWTRMHLDVAG